MIGNPSGYRFEAPGTVVLRPTYFCGGNPVNFAAPLTITVNDGFNQKIDVNWPGVHDFYGRNNGTPWTDQQYLDWVNRDMLVRATGSPYQWLPANPAGW